MAEQFEFPDGTNDPSGRPGGAVFGRVPITLLAGNKITLDLRGLAKVRFVPKASAEVKYSAVLEGATAHDIVPADNQVTLAADITTEITVTMQFLHITTTTEDCIIHLS